MSPERVTQRSALTLAERVAMNIRAELAAQQLTTADLAAVLNVGPRAAARRVSGSLDFSLNETELVAEWLGVSVLTLSRSRVESTVAA